MAEFVGLHVHIALNNGLALEGTVHGVNQATQNLTLHNGMDGWMDGWVFF